MDTESGPTDAQEHLENVEQDIDQRLKKIEERAARLVDDLERERKAMHATNSPPQSLGSPPR